MGQSPTRSSTGSLRRPAEGRGAFQWLADRPAVQAVWRGNRRWLSRNSGRVGGYGLTAEPFQQPGRDKDKTPL